MTLRIESCCTLYLRASLTTRQLLRACRRDWFSWQSGQDGYSLFFQRHKLALRGITSTAAFTVNFSCSSGKVCTTQDKMGVQLGLVHLLSCPCLSRDWRWARRVDFLYHCSFSKFHEGYLASSSFRAFLATSAGLKFWRIALSSCLRPQSARNRTQES